MNRTRNLIPLLSPSLAILMAGSWWLGRRSAQPQRFAPAHPKRRGQCFGHGAGGARGEDRYNDSRGCVMPRLSSG